MKKIILFFLVSLGTYSLLAQDAMAVNHLPSSVREMASTELPSGLNDPDVSEALRKFRRQQMWAFSFKAAGLATAFIATIVHSNNLEIQSEMTSGVRAAFITAGLVSLTGFILDWNAHKHLKIE